MTREARHVALSFLHEPKRDLDTDMRIDRGRARCGLTTILNNSLRLQTLGLPAERIGLTYT